MTIDALPPAPQPTDPPALFDSKAAAFVPALNTFGTQANALAADVVADAAEAAASEAVATAQAGIAATQADTATAAAGTAAAQASIATTEAGEAATSAGEAAASAGTATTQAEIATTEAGTATTQAEIATTQAGISTTKAGEAAASAVLASQTFTATSTTSTALGTGAKTITIETDKGFVVGQYVNVARTSDPTASREAGFITAHNPATGSLSYVADDVTGAGGTFTDWTIGLSAKGGTGAGGGLPLVVVTGTTVTAAANQHLVLTNAAATTATLPASPTAGDTVWVTVANSRFDNVINRNGSNLMGLAENMTVNLRFETVRLRYIDATRGWRLV